MRLVPGGVRPRNGQHRPLRAQFCLAVVSGLAVLAAAGCSTSGGPGGAVSSTITIAAIPGIDNAPLYLALHDNLFSAAGLTSVKILPEPNASAEFAALQDNRAQIAAADYGAIFYHQAVGGGLSILADGYDATSGSLEVLTLPSSTIKTPADLVGTSVGVPDDDIISNRPGNAVSLESEAATEVLSDYTAASTSVKWVPMSQQAEVSELLSGKIKSILVTEPYIFEAESEAGATEVLDAASGFTAQLPLSGYVAQNGWVKSNAAAVADFRSALSQAQSQASVAGPVQKALPKYTGISVEDADLATIGTYPTSTSGSELQRVELMLWQAHLVGSQELNVTQMIAP